MAGWRTNPNEHDSSPAPTGTWHLSDLGGEYGAPLPISPVSGEIPSSRSTALPVSWFTGLLGLLLIPVAWVTLRTLAFSLADAALVESFWRTEEFWFFHMGVLIWGILYLGLRGPTLTCVYVFGHEWTHALATILCGGRLLAWPVISSQGGMVLTNKNNLFISLSPYFVPFYSVGIGLLYVILREFTPLQLGPVYDRTFFGLLGLTWAFHILYTLRMSLSSQPDLRQYGTFFSLITVFLVNLLILCALFVWASPSVDWLSFCRNWYDQALIVGNQAADRWLPDGI